MTLALIDGNLRQQISGSLPERAPNFFFVDIQSSDVAAFSALIGKQPPQERCQGADAARPGDGAQRRRCRQGQVPAEGAWVLKGDRGLTYDAKQPENATLTEGSWWPDNYAGEPLVSFSAEEAKQIGLKLGDTITVNVLGRNVTAKIANFRQVEWETMGINFVMVFSPNTFAGAPHGWLATLTDKNASPADDARLLNAVTRAFPAVTTVRVKDALDIVNRLVAQLGTAIRAAAGVALLASVLVLAGALAAGNRARIHDAVVLKTLGATRDADPPFRSEYMLIGLATAIFAWRPGARGLVHRRAHHDTAVAFHAEVAVATICFRSSSRSASVSPAPGGCSVTRRTGAAQRAVTALRARTWPSWIKFLVRMRFGKPMENGISVRLTNRYIRLRSCS